MYESENNILYYITGYIVHKIKLNCTLGKHSLLMQKYDQDYVSSPHCKLVNFKNRGGFISSSDYVFKIISECELMFGLCKEKKCLFGKKFRFKNY